MKWMALIFGAVIGLAIWIAKRSGAKTERLRQQQVDAEAREKDAKIDATPDLHGDDLRDAWDDKLRKTKEQLP